MLSPQRPDELYTIVDLDEIPAVPCPCGTSRRAFALDADKAATLHVVEIHEDSRAHYHKKRMEIYYVLGGSGEVEIEGARFPLRPGTAVKIRPGCRHRAVGKLKILNVVVPAFDPEDEWFD